MERDYHGRDTQVPTDETHVSQLAGYIREAKRAFNGQTLTGQAFEAGTEFGDAVVFDSDASLWRRALSPIGSTLLVEGFAIPQLQEVTISVLLHGPWSLPVGSHVYLSDTEPGKLTNTITSTFVGKMLHDGLLMFISGVKADEVLLSQVESQLTETLELINKLQNEIAGITIDYGKLSTLNVTSLSLDTGANPTAAYNYVTNTLTLGMPKGVKGDKGDPGVDGEAQLPPISSAINSTSTTTLANSAAVKAAADIATTARAIIDASLAAGQVGNAHHMSDDTSILDYKATGNYIWISTTRLADTPNGMGSYGSMITSSDGSHGFYLVFDRSDDNLYIRLMHPTEKGSWERVNVAVPDEVLSALEHGQIGNPIDIPIGSTLASYTTTGTYKWLAESSITDLPEGMAQSSGHVHVTAFGTGLASQLVMLRTIPRILFRTVLTEGMTTAWQQYATLDDLASLGGGVGGASNIAVVPDWSAPIRFAFTAAIPTLNSDHHIFTDDAFVKVLNGLRIDWIRVDGQDNFSPTVGVAPDFIFVKAGQHATYDPYTAGGGGSSASHPDYVDGWPVKVITVDI